MKELYLQEQVEKRDFRARYCARYHCPPEEFEARLFRHCLHRRARFLGWLVRLYRRQVFNSDLVFLRDVATARDEQELQSAITSYKLDCHRDHSFLHDSLKFRISCRRVKRVFTELAGRKSQ